MVSCSVFLMKTADKDQEKVASCFEDVSLHFVVLMEQSVIWRMIRVNNAPFKYKIIW